MLAGLISWSSPVRGDDGWVPEALFPRPPDPATGTFGVRTGVDWAAGYVPPFRAGARDRGAAGVDATFAFAPFEARLTWDWLVDVSDATGVTSGAGDLRVGTVVTLARPGPFDVTLGWEAKLPNAADEGELGTDETDILFGATGGWRAGPWAARAGVGLAVLGNPLRFANQDDVPLLRASLAWEEAPFAVIGRASADLPTARNPARAEGDVAVRWGSRWHVLVHGGGGFVPAAADWHAGFAVGYAGALPIRRPGA
ncbi:MAG: hypothetical protein ACK4YP_01855 [Myxococcota bacterium]